MIDRPSIMAAAEANDEPGWVTAHRLDAIEWFSRHRAAGRVNAELGGRELGDVMPSGRFAIDDAGSAGPWLHQLFDQKSEADGDGDEALRVIREQLAELEALGVVFCPMGMAVRHHQALVEPAFATVAGPDRGPYAALNAALWSGGSFVHVPSRVAVELPLQALTRLSGRHGGRFERTLIVVGEGASLRYFDGCSAPAYTTEPLHAPVVEVVVGPRAEVTCTTVQNWSANVVNMATAVATVEAGGQMRWVDANVGAGLTSHRPELRLVGAGACGHAASVTVAGPGQRQQVGATVIHGASRTESTVVAKAMATGGGLVAHRAEVTLVDGVESCRSKTASEAMVFDDQSSAQADHQVTPGGVWAGIGHDHQVVSPASEALFYLMSRGLSSSQAIGALAGGFIEPVTSLLPTEYAVEWERLVAMEIDGTTG